MACTCCRCVRAAAHHGNNISFSCRTSSRAGDCIWGAPAKCTEGRTSLLFLSDTLWLRVCSVLATGKAWHYATSLGSIFRCLTTLLMKKFFLNPNLKLPCFNLSPFPHILSLATWEKAYTSFCNLLSGSCRDQQGPPSASCKPNCSSCVMGYNFLHPTKILHFRCILGYRTSKYTVNMYLFFSLTPIAVEGRPRHSPSGGEVHARRKKHCWCPPSFSSQNEIPHTRRNLCQSFCQTCAKACQNAKTPLPSPRSTITPLSLWPRDHMKMINFHPSKLFFLIYFYFLIPC